MKMLLKACLAATALSLVPAVGIAGEIAVIVKTTNSNFWQNVNKGAVAAIEGNTEHTVSFNGPASESAVADQVSLVENAINRGVVGIVLAPSDPEALIPVVKKANESGIPIAIIDSALGDGGNGLYQTFLSTDNCTAGRLAAETMVETVGSTGKVAVMSYVAGAGSEIGRVGCFVEYLEGNSELEIVGPYPDLKGIFGANEPTAVGMGRALVQAGKAGQITAIGFDGNEDLQAFVRDGTLSGTLVQGSFQMGDYGVKAIIDILAGNNVAAQIDTGVVLVTEDNIDAPEAQNVLY
jgi:ribose transport system substrate-binding protein